MLIETKSVTPSDESFLKELFFAVKSKLFFGMPKELQSSLLNLQFQSQQHHYYAHWPKAEHKLLVYNKKTIGQAIIEKSENKLHIVDISILPSLQHQGLGTQYLLSLIDEARAKNRVVNLSVDKDNQALTLYKRIGFRIVDGDQTHYAMEAS